VKERKGGQAGRRSLHVGPTSEIPNQILQYKTPLVIYKVEVESRV
jgi:hypothetical protein